MRKLFYTVVLGCTSILLLPHAAMAGSLDPVKEMEYQKPDNVIVDVAPIDPGTPVDTGIIKDLDTNIKDSSSGSIGSITYIIGSGSIETIVKPGNTVIKNPADDQIYHGEGDYSCKNISCADMGYSQQSIINCSSYVFCPFDVSYKACVNYKEYLQDSCPANAVCEEKYRVTGCKSGYIKDPLTGSCIKDPTSCTPKDCSGYDLTSIPENASYDTCTPGCGDTTKKYKFRSCAFGYSPNESKTACVPQCRGETTCPEGWICTSCKFGIKILYTKKECDSVNGYKKAYLHTCSKEDITPAKPGVAGSTAQGSCRNWSKDSSTQYCVRNSCNLTTANTHFKSYYQLTDSGKIVPASCTLGYKLFGACMCQLDWSLPTISPGTGSTLPTVPVN